MKNFKKIFALLMLAVITVNCSDDDKGMVSYDGESLMHFKETSQQLYVFVDDISKEITVDYNVIKKSSQDNTVKLVPDVENSTAVLGVDYEMVQDTDVLESGEVTGQFKVRFLEAGATQEGKKVVFKLESSTLSSAVFKTLHTVNVNLACYIDDFVGDFESNTYWNGLGYNLIELLPENKLAIRDFWLDNATAPDFILTVDPNTFVVTFQSQNTGYLYQGNANQPVYAIPAADKISTLNPCTREMTLHVEYWVPALNGTFGPKVEVFIGI